MLQNPVRHMTEFEYKAYVAPLLASILESGVEPTKIPAELHGRSKAIFETVKPLFIDIQKVIFSKVNEIHKREVHEAIVSDIYLLELKNGELDFETLRSVADSADIQLPERFLKFEETAPSKQRTGHVRLQRYGKGRCLTKEIWIKPVRINIKNNES